MHFNSSTNNFYDSSQDLFQPALSIEVMLSYLELTKVEYEDALSVSDDDSFQIHTKQLPNSCFVNSCFADRLLAWQANFDIQLVFNHYKQVWIQGVATAANAAPQIGLH